MFRPAPTQGPRSHPLGVELGGTYRDSVTDLAGKATAVAEYLYGCVTVQLTYVDGDMNRCCEWFDLPQLELVSVGAAPRPQMGVPG